MDALQGVQHGPTPFFSYVGGPSFLADHQKNMRSIVASRDGLAIDVVGTNITNWNPDTVPYLTYLTNAGRVGNGNPENIVVVGKKVDDLRTNFAGRDPMAGSGERLTEAELTKPTLTITSAAFSGSNLNLGLTVSANTNKVDVYIDGLYAGSASENFANVSINPGTVASGIRNIRVYAFNRHMAHIAANTTAVR